MEKEFNIKKLNIVFSVIVPGDGKLWPDAGVVVNIVSSVLKNFEESDRAILFELSARVAALPPTDRLSAMKGFEADTPALFRRLVSAVTDAYYTAPEVVAQVEALADAAPREASVHFDEALVASVIRTQAGKYRS